VGDFMKDVFENFSGAVAFHILTAQLDRLAIALTSSEQPVGVVPLEAPFRPEIITDELPG